jgi:hypothetical protein
MKRNKTSIHSIMSYSTHLMFALVIMLSAAFIMAGCGDSSTDANNGGNGNGNGNGETEIGTAPTFNNVSQLFANYCADCHTSAQQSGVRLNNYNNVIESVGDQYGTLVVQPGDADNSPLVDKIESSNPQFGVRMPEGGPFLSEERINQIKAWIDDGAEDDEDNNQSGNNGNNDNENGGNDEGY